MKVTNRAMLEELKEELEELQEKANYCVELEDHELDGRTEDIYTQIYNVVCEVESLLED